MEALLAGGITELLVVGTAHVAHEFLPRYSWQHLEQLLDELRPDALCLELRAVEGETGRFTGATEMYAVGIPWAKKRKRPFYLVDWYPGGDSNKEYEAALRSMASTPEGKARLAPLEDLEMGTMPWLNWKKNAWVTYRDFNSPEQVQIAGRLHQLETTIMGEGPGTNWWNTRNAEICHGIEGAIDGHRGQRVVMLTGYEHKYWLDDYFAGKRDVVLIQVIGLSLRSEFLPDQSFDARVMRLFMFMDGPWSNGVLEPEGILTELDALAKVNPECPPLSYLRGRYYLIAGDLDRAAAAYKEAAFDAGLQWNLGGIRTFPLYPMAMLGMGQALDAKGDRTGAVDCYRKAVESVPSDDFFAKIAGMRMQKPYQRPDAWPPLSRDG